MKFCVFMMGSSHYHDAGWKLPGSYPDIASNFNRWVDLVQRMEAAKIDALFVADVIGPLESDDPVTFARSPRGDRFHPIPLLSALSVVTKKVGLIATVATSYARPYDVARELASIDRISGGRAGWNVVTGNSAADAAQYGDESYLPPEERYKRGGEFVDVVTKLWGSVATDAFSYDVESGVYANPEKVRTIDHHGEYYSVKGPLSLGPSPQSRPVIVQAGQSPPGRALAARVAEVVFTAQSDMQAAKAFRSDVRAQAEAFGRSADGVKIMPGVVPIVGRTEEEADMKLAKLNALVDPAVALSKMQAWLHGIDLSKCDLDAPFPELPESATQSRGANYAAMARKENLTLRQVVQRASIGDAHLLLKGTAESIVDTMQEWFEGGAADGFNLLCTSFPDALDDFITLIIPELRRRGLFREDYEGDTLRANLGLPD
jgi:FMN-dependent oxidoreductase (nitrilotriacetate monooxygenase family)